MDLRAYYKTVRETEATLPSPHVVLVSKATPDGGKEGVVTEVPTPIAARMLVEGSARQATGDEAASFHQKQEEVRVAAHEAAEASKLQVVVVPSSKKQPSRDGKE